MGYHSEYDRVISEQKELESKLENIQTLINLLEAHDIQIDLWDVPDEDDQIEIEDLGGDLDDTVGQALEKAKTQYAELECELDEVERDMRILEGHLGIV